MCYIWISEICSLKKVFKITCALLTLFLIYRALYTFSVTKPTSTSRAEKDLKITDLPEVVICLEPGLDSEKLEGYGYKIHSYYKGKVDHSGNLSWNGRKGETKSSREILDETLIVKKQHINSTKFIWRATYYSSQGVRKGKVDLRTLAHPFGRCFNISPAPSQKNVSDNGMINQLTLRFNENVFKKYKDVALIGIYFMDKTNSLKIYPDENDILGNPLRLRWAEFSNHKSTYKTKISRSRHVQGDPLLKCNEYTSSHPYNDCIQDELHDKFDQLLGCTPPLLGTDPRRICNERFNLSKDKNKEVSNLMTQIHVHSGKFKCPTPCTKNKYTTTLLKTAPHPNARIKLVFDETIEVASSTFSMNGLALLSNLGGSVSSAQCVHWTVAFPRNQNSHVVATKKGNFQQNTIAFWGILCIATGEYLGGNLEFETQEN